MSRDSGSSTCSGEFVNDKDDNNKSEVNQFRQSPDLFDDRLSEPEENSVQIIGELSKNTGKSLSIADINKNEDLELIKKIEMWRQQPSVFYKTPSAETITSSHEMRRGVKRTAEEFEDNSESLLSENQNEKGADWKRIKAWREEDNYEKDDEAAPQDDEDKGIAEKDKGIADEWIADENSQHLTEEDSPAPIEEDTSYHLITDLIDDAVSDKDVAKLFAAGYSTIEAFVFETKRNLQKIPGLSEEKIDRMLKSGREKTRLSGFTTASEIHAKRQEILSITTGCKALDRILGNGIETGSITEISGLAGSGKTQLCLTLAVTCQLPVERGGAAGKCIYVDSEGGFRSERLVAVANRFQLDVKSVLDNIGYSRSYNTNHQDQLIVIAAALMTESRYALLIVDSATSLYRTDYDGLRELYSRQIHLAKFLRTLLRLADEFGVAVVITNQMRANMGGSMLFGDANVPIGGNIVGHATSTRLSIRRSRGSTRICRIVASASQPESEVVFDVTEEGVNDVRE